MAEESFDSTLPAVFMYQPVTYSRLETPEELARWERAMLELVGLPIDATRLASVGTECKCGNPPAPDDCDY